MLLAGTCLLKNFSTVSLSKYSSLLANLFQEQLLEGPPKYLYVIVTSLLSKAHKSVEVSYDIQQSAWKREVMSLTRDKQGNKI